MAGKEVSAVLYEDLDYEAQLAIAIYNRLSNRMYPDIGFTGKDLHNLAMLVELYGYPDTEELLDYISVMEDADIRASQKSIKASIDKVKNGKKEGPN